MLLSKVFGPVSDFVIYSVVLKVITAVPVWMQFVHFHNNKYSFLYLYYPVFVHLLVINMLIFL